MKKKNPIIFITSIITLSLVASFSLLNKNKDSSSVVCAISETPGGVGLENDPINIDPVAQEYYSGISSDLSGDSLKNALYNLIHPNKCKTSYSSIWDYLVDCDVDPNNREGNNIIPFYRTSITTKNACNKEHVWPNSRGGDCIEGDPHMVRPTLTSDNSSRGNSCYVEGMNSSTSGWDPKAANMSETSRGEAARIIFYCSVQEKDKLRILDTNNPNVKDGSVGQMGKLSDLIRWNYEYPITDSERLRNEVLSGETSVHGSDYNFNRNPFIDDRSLVCRIYRDYNGETQRLCSIYEPLVKPTSLTLNKNALHMSYGGTETLSISSVTPQGAGKTVTWSSNNPSVASVSNGFVTAYSDGTAIITATSTLDSSVKATCTVTVSTDLIDISSVTCQENVETYVNATYTLTPSYLPNNAYPKPSYSFTSNNPSVASVSNDGIIKGVSVGQTSITVKATQGSINKSTIVNVNVKETPPITKHTISFKSNTNDGSATLAGSQIINQIDEGFDLITSIGSSSKIFEGKNGLKFGSSSSNGSLTINFKDYISKISLDGSTIDSGASLLINGETVDFNEEVILDNVQSVTISSRKRCYLKSIDIYSKGNSVINVTGVSLNKSSLSLNVGDSSTLVASVTPESATDKTVNWSSSNTNVATVTDGIIKAISSGVSTITVKTNDGNFTSTCIVTVKSNPVASEEMTIVDTDLPTSYDTNVEHKNAKGDLRFKTYNVGNFGSGIQFKKSGSHLYSIDELELSSIKLEGKGISNLTVYGGQTINKQEESISSSDGTFNLDGYKYFAIKNNTSSAQYLSKITVYTKTSGSLSPADEATKYAKGFNAADVCGTNNNVTAISSIWLEQKVLFDLLSNEAKYLLTNGQANANGASEIEKCLARYDRVIYLHGEDSSKYPDFMSRNIDGHYLSNATNINSSNSFNLVVCGSIALTASAILSLYIFKKKKN